MLPRIAIICQKLLQKLPKIFNCFPIVFPLLSNRSSVPFQLLPNCFSIISNCPSNRFQLLLQLLSKHQEMLASSTADNKTMLSSAGHQISFGSQYSHSIITSSISNNRRVLLTINITLKIAIFSFHVHIKHQASLLHFIIQYKTNLSLAQLN